jgi:hypothetical protein
MNNNKKYKTPTDKVAEDILAIMIVLRKYKKHLNKKENIVNNE